MVERLLAKEEVAGSTPVFRSINTPRTPIAVLAGFRRGSHSVRARRGM